MRTDQLYKSKPPVSERYVLWCAPAFAHARQRVTITFRYWDVFLAGVHRCTYAHIDTYSEPSVHLKRRTFGCYVRRMTQRRSRMHRTRTGKHLALTVRDLEIFEVLCRYRFLRSTYLYAFVGGASEKRFIERLGDLFHEGYLDRPAEQWRFSDARCLPVVYKLGKGGRDALAKVRSIRPSPYMWLRDGPHRQFEHSLMICEVLASLELATHGRDDIRFIPWTEILAKAPETTRRSSKPYVLSTANGETVVPDALFGLEYSRDGRKTYRFFALEVDRGTMPIARASSTGTSVLTKLEAYLGILAQEGYRRWLGIPNLLVLTVTTSNTRCVEIVQRYSKRLVDGRPFLFRAFYGTTAPDPSLLAARWSRPRFQNLCIDLTDAGI